MFEKVTARKTAIKRRKKIKKIIDILTEVK